MAINYMLDFFKSLFKINSSNSNTMNQNKVNLKLVKAIETQQSAHTIIKLIQEEGADPNAILPLPFSYNPIQPLLDTPQQLLTPLQLAVVYKNLPLIVTLIDNGAQVNKASEPQLTATAHIMSLLGIAIPSIYNAYIITYNLLINISEHVWMYTRSISPYCSTASTIFPDNTQDKTQELFATNNKLIILNSLGVITYFTFFINKKFPSLFLEEPRTPIELALNGTLTDQQREIVQILLERGANPDLITDSTLSILPISDPTNRQFKIAKAIKTINDLTTRKKSAAITELRNCYELWKDTDQDFADQILLNYPIYL